MFLKKNEKYSTILKIINPYINSNYLTVNKGKEVFLIKNRKDDSNLTFWKNIYSNWENETFDIFDKALDINKIFIDIGAWIGTTCMYASRKSKHIYCIEADKNSFDDMSLNLKENCSNNYTLINKAIYNIDDIEVKFGKNKFLNNSKMNDSTSQIYSDNEVSNEYYLINTITINKLLKVNNIDTSEISLIKVDIEGGEEYILNDLFSLHKNHNVPLYISFHYSWWNNKNLNRFDFLTQTQKSLIISNPFVSIFFK